MKLCTIWSAESRDEQGTPVRDEGSVTYSAALESACALDTAASRSPFAQRVWREATRRRFRQASRRVVLGDGALWIWNIADDQFPGATQIVDRYHAKEYLSDLGKALYGPAAPRAAQWAERRKAELDAGKFPALLNAIRRQVRRSDLARRCLHYFKTNRERMRYTEFHAQGLCTSSGVVEAGCKVAIGTRLKRAGMHWTKPGSNAIIALGASGSADQNAGPHDLSFSWRAPNAMHGIAVKKTRCAKSPFLHNCGAKNRSVPRILVLAPTGNCGLQLDQK